MKRHYALIFITENGKKVLKTEIDIPTRETKAWIKAVDELKIPGFRPHNAFELKNYSTTKWRHLGLDYVVDLKQEGT